MKIQSLKIFVVGNPPPSYGGPYFVFVKLITDTGVEGLGECYGFPFGPHAIVPMIEDVFERHVLGADPHQIERLSRVVYASGYTHHPDLTIMAILSGFEMACWDIIGKEANQPVYALLGGRVHETLRSYTYIYARPEDTADVYMDADLSAERAEEYVAMGFTGVKFDPVGGRGAFDPRQLSLESLERSAEFVRKMRDAVGTKADLLFGTHGQMTTSSAIRLAKRIEFADPLWMEEPVPPENALEMARVAQHTSIPIATGERLSTRHEFLRLLQNQSAQILQMNLARVGGILEAKKIASMAETFYAQIAPHLYNGVVAGAANIQLATCSPNFLILEGIERWDGFHAELLKKPIVWQDGYVIPPTEPGLGIELNEEVALAHPYTGSPHRRHLEQTEEHITQ